MRCEGCRRDRFRLTMLPIYRQPTTVSRYERLLLLIGKFGWCAVTVARERTCLRRPTWAPRPGCHHDRAPGMSSSGENRRAAEKWVETSAHASAKKSAGNRDARPARPLPGRLSSHALQIGGADGRTNRICEQTAGGGGAKGTWARMPSVARSSARDGSNANSPRSACPRVSCGQSAKTNVIERTVTRPSFKFNLRLHS